LSRLFYYSLALSAWKQVTTSTGKVRYRWSLRANPSSGNLHPTEAYLIGGPEPGVYHYAPFEHGLELRRKLVDWPAPDTLLIGLTSVYWRESWKYGERAFRYCHHDTGHAIGALTIAAAALGWNVYLDDSIGTRQLAELLGIHEQNGVEAEHADCLLILAPGPRPSLKLSGIRGEEWLGSPNRLSATNVPWTVIDEVSEATESPGLVHESYAGSDHAPAIGDRGLASERILRQRRSALGFDGATAIDRETFFRILWRVMPAANPMPFAVLPWRPLVSLALFVHRVKDITPGVHMLVRHPSHEEQLRRAMRPEFLWERAEGASEKLPLYLLLPGDVTEPAKTISCHQDIASMGVFAAGMLAEFDAALAANGAPMYPRMFWETGLVGQVLYLEAEAAGIRATGIGCFFDDACHRLLGIQGHAWQSLYHFTMGGPVEDPRLQTVASYEHLKVRAAEGADAWPEA
jgi:SagB-type dehydrogenase family enzyme